MLTDQTWEVFDEFVQRIGSDGTWEYAVIRQRRHYEALTEAGFLRRSPEHTLEMYGLTPTGRREVCRRDGEHDFDRDRPAPGGCRMCDASLCSCCQGSGSHCDEYDQHDPLPCDDCIETGLQESA